MLKKWQIFPSWVSDPENLLPISGIFHGICLVHESVYPVENFFGIWLGEIITVRTIGWPVRLSRYGLRGRIQPTIGFLSFDHLLHHIGTGKIGRASRREV